LPVLVRNIKRKKNDNNYEPKKYDMKKYIYAVLLALGISMAMSSCTRESFRSYIMGDWKTTLISGSATLNEVVGIQIGTHTVTMYFDTGYYSYLFSEYGDYHTVDYIFRAYDTDSYGGRGMSLTFDHPLYFWSDDYGDFFVQKVFLAEDRNGFVMWDEDCTHEFYLQEWYY